MAAIGNAGAATKAGWVFKPQNGDALKTRPLPASASPITTNFHSAVATPAFAFN